MVGDQTDQKTPLGHTDLEESRTGPHAKRRNGRYHPLIHSIQENLGNSGESLGPVEVPGTEWYAHR